MPLLSREDELNEYGPSTWTFWRNLALYFCAFSLIGHWLEIIYCTFMRLFGIYDPESLVWDDPFYPFLIYGIGVVVCAALLVPLKERLIRQRKTLVGAGFQFFIITVFVCMLMELIMGLLLNQPNHLGEYPLWDNSQLPLNIFNQAWLVNDLVLGAVAMFYTWLVYPLCEKYLAKVPSRIVNLGAFVLVASFIILCIVKFSA